MPQQRNLRGIDRGQRLLKGDCSCYAVYCEGRQPSELADMCASSTCASEEQSDSENKGACGREQRKHIDHIAEKGMQEVFTMAWHTNQSPFKKQ